MSIKSNLPHSKITHKLIIFLILTSFIPIISLVSILKVHLKKQLDQYQDKEIIHYEEHFNYNLHKHRNYMKLIAFDYAEWDDAYEYTMDKNHNWLRENIVDWLPTYHKFTYTAIIDNSQQLILENIDGFYFDYREILNGTPTLLGDVEYIYLSNQLYMAIKANITTSIEEEYIAGQLIILHKIDRYFLEEHLNFPDLNINLSTTSGLIIENPLLKAYIDTTSAELESQKINNYLYHFTPITNISGDRLAYGILEIPYHFYIQALKVLSNWLLLIYLVTLVFFVLSIYFMKKHFINPINHAKEVIHQIRSTGKPIPISIYSRDELGSLCHSFNELAIEIDKYNRDLEKRSITDEVTQLYNARHFSNILDTRIKKREPFVMIFIDIDFIKSYNNLFKPSQTDLLIQHIAALIQTSMKVPLTFRIESSVFALIFEKGNINVATELVKQFQQEISVLDFYGKENLPIDLINASAGITLFPEEAITKDSLIKITENKLYNARYFLTHRIGNYYTVFQDAVTQENIKTVKDAYQMTKILLLVLQSMDQYTLCHSEGVAKYSLDIGKKIGLSLDDLETLEYGALLHDLGKIQLGSDLLNKVGKLSGEELQKIRNHPIFGINILCSIDPLAAILPIVKHHHEWFDGTGYPAGLKKDSIPFLARIVSVADAYDSMTTNRPYRSISKNHEEAIAELIKFSGTQFDPQIVEVFTSIS